MTDRAADQRAPWVRFDGWPLLAVLAILVVGLSVLAAGPAHAAEPGALTATVAPAVFTYPGSAVISGGGAAPGTALLLFARPAGATEWPDEPVAAATAAAAGSYRFKKVSPSATTEYRVEAREGDLVVAEAEVRLRVRPRVTTAFPAGLWLGGSVKLRGRVEPAHPGGTVTIERRVGGAWQPFITDVTLNAGSRFVYTWRPEQFGFHRLRVRMAAAEDHDAGVSAAQRVIVNRPNRHRVPMRFAHYIVIVRREYRLYYYERGVMVRRFEVALGRPGYRTPLGRFRVYGKRKPAGGALGSCAIFYRRKGGIAIHGTNEPWLIKRPIPRAYSHGCARMLNREVLWLYKRVPVGTRIRNLR